MRDYKDEVAQVSSLECLAVDDSMLASIESYNKMLLSLEFYKLFASWDYLLIFQHDAWILSGDLDHWLLRGYSYVGAPWCAGLSNNSDCRFAGVGNGGLSLRSIQDMISLLSSRDYHCKPVYTLAELVTSNPLMKGYDNRPAILRPFAFLWRLGWFLPFLLLYPLGYRNSLHFYSSKGISEDIILSLLAKRVCQWLRIPDAATAAWFSIETNPSQVVSEFDIDVPFGCHAWQKYDMDFYLDHFAKYFTELCS